MLYYGGLIIVDTSFMVKRLKRYSIICLHHGLAKCHMLALPT